MTEAQRLAYRAVQEALDRRDNGGRAIVYLEPGEEERRRESGSA
jgi:hypothetical protein